ncbi:MAG: YicC family protein [Candidatus Lambdaproteobacteria bacterium]|nr:YicC family protein [Candidatus Lambdaproteobacteria bacterium]
MTGFGRAELERQGWRCGVEIRSVNSRFLDVRLRLPQPLQHLEEQYKRQIREQCERGKVDCSVALTPGEGAGAAYVLNRDLARQYGALIGELQQALGATVNVNLEDLLANRQLVGGLEAALDEEGADALATETVALALQALQHMREREGELLRQDLSARVANLGAMLDELVPLTRDLPAVYAQRLREKLALLAGDGPIPAEERIVQEIALYADRCDVSEELTRFRAHLAHLTHLMDDRGALGRKIEFLLQELNREANTLSVKSSSAPVSERVVDIKAELEKLREQIQNIE